MNTVGAMESSIAELEELERAGLAAFEGTNSAETLEKARVEFLGQKQGKIKGRRSG